MGIFICYTLERTAMPAIIKKRLLQPLKILDSVNNSRRSHLLQRVFSGNTVPITTTYYFS